MERRSSNGGLGFIGQSISGYNRGVIYVGTSGFAYKQWKGTFYPDKLPQKDFLSYYADQLPTTEINNTFYRSPSVKLTADWRDKVPEGFRFTLKLNQRITHKQRLAEAEDGMTWFLKGAAELGEKLGCILVQLPPWFRADLERLQSFLDAFAGKAPMAFEFRHESWFQDKTYQALERSRQTLAIVETEERTPERRLTGPFAYLRLRKEKYTESELEEWAGWLSQLDRDAFVYFKHEDEAPLLAQRLLKHISS